MNKTSLSKIIDATYLPRYTDYNPITILDETNLTELRESFQFACRHRFRSFCTYPFLAPMIQASVCPITLSLVEDFPLGDKGYIEKIADIGELRNIGKMSSRYEIDWVLSPSYHNACTELDLIKKGHFHRSANFKIIVELGTRPMQDIIYMLPELEQMAYIKTNTGRDRNIDFKEKIELVKLLRTHTKHPLKISGSIKSPEQIEAYFDIAGEKTIFGVSISTLKEWKEFK